MLGGIAMGGGGGFSGYSSASTKDRINEAEKAATLSGQQMEINQFLENMLKEYNDRDIEAIQKHLEVIEKTLDREIEGIDKILFGGSVSKSTFVEGMSDVDALVILDYDMYKSSSPKELQAAFYSLLKKRFPQTELKCGALAVTLKFSDYEVQLLPAIRNNGRIKIASTTGDGWSSAINTDAFKERLTKVNKANNNKVVPVVKVAKKILSNLPEKYQLSGYHIEALAVDAFRTYTGRATLYDMTLHLLDHISSRIKQPMHDITGQSGDVDSEFGGAQSITRQKISNYIKDLAGRFSSTKYDAETLFD